MAALPTNRLAAVCFMSDQSVQIESDDSTSSSLLRRARIQDPAAWRRLVDTYGRRVYRWCRQSGLQPADANNVAQDVFAVIARKLSTFEYRQDGDTFRGWMRRITQNKIRDHFRSANRVPRASGGTNWFRQVAELEQSPVEEISQLRSVNADGRKDCEFIKSITRAAGGSGDVSKHLEKAMNDAQNAAAKAGADSYFIEDVNTTASGASVVLEALRCK